MHESKITELATLAMMSQEERDSVAEFAQLPIDEQVMIAETAYDAAYDAALKASVAAGHAGNSAGVSEDLLGELRQRGRQYERLLHAQNDGTLLVSGHFMKTLENTGDGPDELHLTGKLVEARVAFSPDTETAGQFSRILPGLAIEHPQIGSYYAFPLAEVERQRPQDINTEINPWVSFEKPPFFDDLAEAKPRRSYDQTELRQGFTAVLRFMKAHSEAYPSMRARTKDGNNRRPEVTIRGEEGHKIILRQSRNGSVKSLWVYGAGNLYELGMQRPNIPSESGRGLIYYKKGRKGDTADGIALGYNDRSTSVSMNAGTTRGKFLRQVVSAIDLVLSHPAPDKPLQPSDAHL